ncbi:MAG: cyclic nucleotide-binding domain-containing protein [Candidatus Sericytochromatia bacterium]
MTNSISDGQIKARLIQQGLIPAARLEKVWRTYQGQKNALIKSLAGTLCSVDAEGVLQFRRFPGNELLFKIPLLRSDQAGFEATGEPPAARLEPADTGTGEQVEKDWEWAYIDGLEGNLLQEKTLPAATPVSLLLTKQACYLHYPDFEHAEHLALSSFLPDHPSRRPRHHFDLYVSPDRRYLLASHRESGELTLISLEHMTRLKSMQLLSKGSAKALNVAFDITRKSAFKAYISDNQSQYLYVVDLANMHAHTWASGMGSLGNLLMTRDRRFLFLLTHQPQLGLRYLDKEQLKPLRTLKTKGVSLCYDGPQPQDLMLMAPDTPLLMLMTRLEDQGLPVVQVVDINETKTLKRYSLKNLKAPDLMVCGIPNPLQELGSQSLEQLILEEGLLSPEDWDVMMQDLERQAQAGTLAKEEIELPPSPAWEMPPEAIIPAEQDAPAEPDFKAPPRLQQDPEVFELLDKDGEAISLPAEANEAIFRLFVWYFYQVTLTNLEIHGPELFKLRKVAARTRKRLESKLAVMVVIPAILGKYTLELPISRKMVFSFLEEMRRNQAQSYHLNLCPSCRTVMASDAGCPRCPECGLALDLPEEKSWRRLVSAEASSHLPAGQMLFVFKEANRLLVMTPWHQVLFLFDGAAAGVRSLGDAVVLPNLNFLVTDTGARRIAEYSNTGQLIWSSRLPLQRPVSATVYLSEEYEERFLIVDQGLKEVLETNRKGQVLRKYPEPGAAVPLLAPAEVQRSPDNHWLILDTGSQQVIEVDADGALVHCWNRAQGLSRPVFARRLPQGETLIVDASGQILVFDAFNALSQSMRYWPPETPSAFSASPAPEKVMRLHNGELLCAGRGFYLLVNPQAKTSRGPYPLSQNPDAHKTLIKLQVSASERSIDKQQQLTEQSLFLKQVPLLEETTEKQRLTIAEQLTSLRFRAGETIIADLGQSTALYFIVEGCVELRKQEVLIKSLGTGDVFGEVGLVLATGKLEVSAQAQSACQLLMLERNAFKKVILRFPRFFHLVRFLAMDRQALLRRYQDEKSQAMTDKLALKLMITKVSQHPLFKGKGAAIHEALAHCLKPVAFMPNQVIYSRGESAGNLYIINEGQVGIIRKGEHRPGLTLSDGQILGEMSFFTGQQRAATVTTLDYCKMYEMAYHDLQTLSNRHLWLKIKLEQIVNERIAQNQADLAAFERHMGITRPDLPQTEAWKLLELQEDELVFFAPVGTDLVLGVENSGEILWCSGREAQLSFERVTRLLQWGDAVYITDTGQQRIVGLDINTRQLLMAWENQTRGLHQPRSAWITEDQLLLVADEGGSRLLMLNEQDQEVWAYEAPHEILNPMYAEATDKGTILFADAGLHMVYEISREGEVLWSYGKLMIAGDGPGELAEPAFAHRLDSGETLIADTGNDRLVVVSREGRENAIFYGTDQHPLVQPIHCQVRANGDTLVFSASETRVVRLDLWGEPIWSLKLTAAYPMRATSHLLPGQTQQTGRPAMPTTHLQARVQEPEAEPESSIPAAEATDPEHFTIPSTQIQDTVEDLLDLFSEQSDHPDSPFDEFLHLEDPEQELLHATNYDLAPPPLIPPEGLDLSIPESPYPGLDLSEPQNPYPDSLDLSELESRFSGELDMEKTQMIFPDGPDLVTTQISHPQNQDLVTTLISHPPGLEPELQKTQMIASPLLYQADDDDVVEDL